MENERVFTLQLIPQPKEIVINPGFLENRRVHILAEDVDPRVGKLLKKLPLSPEGVGLKLETGDKDEDGYQLIISENGIEIKADGAKGAFYAVQTLRQIFENDHIPYCEINDLPDFEYRGAYLDITRGKVPKLETIKEFIDKIAYYKMNSLQLYVEHTYEFEEYADNLERTGYITSAELKALDSYCKDNFIDFIPSLSTFGHLYELLEKDRYKHLCSLDNYQPDHHFWIERQKHHTIDPLHPESFPLIQSLIDQYLPNFTSEWFNICCDETFDLKESQRHKDKDTGELYISFVSQIIDHLHKNGKKIMMWGDVLLNHPEQIGNLPEDTVLLNWFYRENPDPERIKFFHDAGKPQVLCVGTQTWTRFCENMQVALLNIQNMTQLGHRYGAKGILTSIWGDWGHTSSLALAECSLAFGAERSWNVETNKDDIFSKVDKLIYRTDGLSEYAKALSGLQSELPWVGLILLYEDRCMGIPHEFPYYAENIMVPFIEKCQDFCKRLENEPYDNKHKQEMLVVAEGFIVMAEIAAVQNGSKMKRSTNTEQWLKKYRELWLSNNKESELREIENIFTSLEMKGAEV